MRTRDQHDRGPSTMCSSSGFFAWRRLQQSPSRRPTVRPTTATPRSRPSSARAMPPPRSPSTSPAAANHRPRIVWRGKREKMREIMCMYVRKICARISWTLPPRTTTTSSRSCQDQVRRARERLQFPDCQPQYRSHGRSQKRRRWKRREEK